MNVALCLFHKDENAYLPEWLKHHRALGVTHFYIYDNESGVVPSDLGDDVTIEQFKGDYLGKQMKAYYYCLQKYGKRHDFIGFIDTDEFIMEKRKGLFLEVLASLKQSGSLGLNWRMFGSDGRKTKPKGTHITSYKKWIPNDHIKSIVNTSFSYGVPRNPHYFDGRKPTYNENGERITEALHPHSSSKVWINHYFTRSEQEWSEKIKRGRGDGAGRRTMQEFHDFNKQFDND